MVSALAETIIGRRDACLPLLGFASALRRSELVALDVSDIDDTADGLVVTIRRSKTDQEGEGRQLGIPYGADPARARYELFVGGWRPPGSPMAGAACRRPLRRSRQHTALGPRSGPGREAHR